MSDGISDVDDTDAADNLSSESDLADDAPKRTKRSAAIPRPYPRRTLEDALRIPLALKTHNGGNPWEPGQVATAVNMGGKSGSFYYLTAASRDFGLTEGTRDTATIKLTELGRRAVYPQSDEDEANARREAFLKIEKFRRLVEHFGGSELPEKRFLENTLETTYSLTPKIHDEFIDLFRKNCRFVGIGADYATVGAGNKSDPKRVVPATTVPSGNPGPVVAVTSTITSRPVCFVIMPFSERDEARPVGFFEEVMDGLFTPAITAAGFTAATAKRQGSDVIHSTIVTELLAADLVLADLTEHNPNVLFELGMRMAEDKPVALVRAKGTGPIFDVDNMLRVEEYNPNLWASTVEKDLPRIQQHLMATWENRETEQTFVRILRGNRP